MALELSYVQKNKKLYFWSVLYTFQFVRVDYGEIYLSARKLHGAARRFHKIRLIRGTPLTICL